LFVKYREFYGALPYPDSSRAFLEKRLRRKESVIYLALPDDDDNKLLGFCQLYPSFSSLSLKRVWILNDIYVAEDARRQLVADNLIRTAKKMAKETHAVRMRCPPAATTKWRRRPTNPSAFGRHRVQELRVADQRRLTRYQIPLLEGACSRWRCVSRTIYN
jgi:GNAT superfamily N-acetyltransferase